MSTNQLNELKTRAPSKLVVVVMSTSQDRFALRQLLWSDFSTYKSYDSSAKVIPSLHAISLAVRDRQCNELPAKFKIT